MNHRVYECQFNSLLLFVQHIIMFHRFAINPDDMESFFTESQRHYIVDFILDRTRFTKLETEQDMENYTGYGGESGFKDGEQHPPERQPSKTDEKGEEEDGGVTYGIEHLITEGTYLAAYPLHDADVDPVPSAHSHSCAQSGVSRSKQGSPAHEANNAAPAPERPSEELLTRHRLRTLLYKNWGSWSNIVSLRFQPLDHVRAYLGEQFAFYFAWLGFYTLMLLPASIVGLIVFIHGLRMVWFSDDPVACVTSRFVLLILIQYIRRILKYFI